ncbi:hypothetical protein Tco_0205461 [Tanacetum coccineum]
MHQSKSQSEHTDEFHKLVGDLEAIDTVISDEDGTLLLLTYLPSSYDNIMDTLLYGRDNLKLEDVLATLFSRELHKMTEAKGDGGEWLTGKVQVHMMDGSSFVLNKVTYVPELRQNLISLGTLTNEGFTVKMQSGKIKSRVPRFFGQRIQSCLHNAVNRSPSSAIECKTPIDMFGVVCWFASINQRMLEPVKVNCIFLGFPKGMGSVHVLQGVEFKVEPQEDHAIEVEPQGNVDHLLSYEEDNNDAAFVVAEVEKIYAHESLTFNDIVSCEVIFKWKDGLKEAMDARSDAEIWVTKGLLVKTKRNVLGMEIVKDQSGNTLRVS